MNFPTVNRIRQLGIKPDKKHGQNFLIDMNIASRTVDCADISPTDTVIEIGAGLGSLTFFLAKKQASTISFELDKQLFKILTYSLPYDSHVSIINQDILQVNYEDYFACPKKSVLIGSIPYSITTPILLNVFKDCNFIKHAVFIVQKEVAKRLCESPGSRDYGVLSVYCSAYLKTSLLFSIPPECFYPKPKVDSAVISMVPIHDRNWKDEDEALFRQVIRAAFSNKRKMINNCLKNFAAKKKIDPDQLREESARSGIDLKRRAETLSAEEFYKLTSVVRKLKQC